LATALWNFGSEKFSAALKLSPGSTRCWSVAGAEVIEIVATLLTVKLLVPMSGLEQTIPEVA
jgi:hypothetical protein